MDKIWLKNYPKDIPHEIDVDAIRPIGESMRTACEKFSARTAFECLGIRMSFKQFNQDSDAVAAFMQKRMGIRKGDRVAIMVPNLLQFAVCFLAAQKIGAICINTNPLYTPREMQHQFNDSGADSIVILDLFMDKLEEIVDTTKIKNIMVTSIGDYLPFIKKTILGAMLKFKGQLPSHNLKAEKFLTALRTGRGLDVEYPNVDPEEIALLQYTGGTTGLSKGAMLSHRNIMSNVKQIQSWFGDYATEKKSEVVLQHCRFITSLL